jgi:pyruvate kinase
MEIKHQNTKIVATLGPACSSVEQLKGLIKAGADVLRLNFSHGDHAGKKEVVDRIIKINEDHNLNIGILADLQGPKLRVGEMKDGGCPVNSGDIITFTSEKCIGTSEKAYMSYQSFAQDVKVGEKVLCDDGKLVFEVVETDGDKNVKLKAMFGGVLKSNKGVNLPDTAISLPSLTEKDKEDLKFILTLPVHWIALSFVREAKDIIELKEKIAAGGHKAKVIAKIEKPEAVANIKEIIKATDAIMVARGDLGVEVPLEKLPSIQKNIIARCIQKPVIVATQMMESMINAPSPTRAEVADVANAVLDGTDAVMLSGETSVGDHPALVVETMSKIIADAEQHYALNDKRPKPNKNSETFYSDTICINASKIADDIKANALCGLTVSGYTAFKLASYRPSARIFIFSSIKEMLPMYSLIWGVKPYFYDKFESTDSTISDLEVILKERGHLEAGDTMVNTGSMPLHKRFRSNMLKITIVE